MRKQSLGTTIGALILLLVMVVLPGGAFAADPDQVALVVQYAEGKVDTLCIALGEDEISGADLLTRSGLDLIIDTASMGVTICQIQDVGCAYPADACFCQCMGGADCAYWNYFYRDPGEAEWSYSALGAAMRKVTPGSVEAWVWGDGRTPPADDLTFEAICLPPEPTATYTLQPTNPPATAPPAGTESPALTPTQVPTQTPSHTPTALPTATNLPPSATPTPIVAASQGGSSTWFFGLALSGLVIAGAYVWLRGGQSTNKVNT